jgi:aminoglycoside phosphotransferase (APT) family kinase protein
VPDRAAELQGSLARVLSRLIGHEVEVVAAAQLSGGASKESWAFDLVDGAQRTPLILRRDPPGAAVGSPARIEHAVLDAVRSAGVPAPRVLWSGAVQEWGGASFTVMERVDGETLAPRILRDPAFATARAHLLQQCAQALARIHSVAPAAVAPPLQHRSVVQLVDEVEAMLDAAPDPHPVFEVALRWLRSNLPPPQPPSLVHADFRMGNLIVGPEGLRAVLDWELSHVGDPVRDLGYFCVRSWRFGVDDQAAGGLGTREELVAAYRAAGGRDVDMAAVHYWEVYGTTVWGVQTTYLAQQFLRHGIRSVELAAIGRRAVEMEHDVLALLTDGRAAQRDDAERHSTSPSRVATQDRPDATELLSVTADFLQQEVMPQLDGRLAFHVRVAANVLRIVEREVALGPEHEAADRAGLAALLGGGTDLTAMRAELARRIRAGEVEGSRELIDFLLATTARRLAVANPRHLRGRGAVGPV